MSDQSSEPAAETVESVAEAVPVSADTIDAIDGALAEGALGGNDAPTASDADDALDASGESVEISEEAVVGLIAQRDDYLDALQRLKAEFANFRRRTDESAADQRRQAASALVERLLPVLDSCDAAIAQGVDAVAPIRAALFDTLTAQGLATMESTGVPFDPQLHEAVLHESGDGDAQMVIETLRTGYLWNDRVLRAAMVKVQG